MVYVMHGIFETSERYASLVSKLSNTVSLQIHDFSSIRGAAMSVAPRLQSADAIIAYGCSGLLLYDMLQLGLIPPPRYVVFVSVPFKGVRKTTENTVLLNTLRFRLNTITTRLLAYKLMAEPDAITIRGIRAHTNPELFNTYKEVMDYHTVLTPLPKSKTFICLGGRDSDINKYTFPYAQEVTFESCGKHVIKDAEAEFLQFLYRIGEYQW